MAVARGYGSWKDGEEPASERPHVRFFNLCLHPSGKPPSFVVGLSVPKVPCSITS